MHASHSALDAILQPIHKIPKILVARQPWHLSSKMLKFLDVLVDATFLLNCGQPFKNVPLADSTIVFQELHLELLPS